jgi:hypothetical protein
MKIDIDNLPNCPELLRKIIADQQREMVLQREKYAILVEQFLLANSDVLHLHQKKIHYNQTCLMRLALNYPMK